MNFTCLSPDEIRAMYRDAADKQAMIGVLAELTLSSQKEMAEFLGVEMPCYVGGQRKPKVSIDQTRAWELYRAGLSEREMARELGVSRSAVNSWRHKHGLPLNSAQPVKADEKQRLALYRQGLDDREIAAELGMSKGAIFSWRKNKKLPPNGTRGGNRKKKGNRTNEGRD